MGIFSSSSSGCSGCAAGWTCIGVSADGFAMGIGCIMPILPMPIMGCIMPMLPMPVMVCIILISPMPVMVCIMLMSPMPVMVCIKLISPMPIMVCIMLMSPMPIMVCIILMSPMSIVGSVAARVDSSAAPCASPSTGAVSAGVESADGSAFVSASASTLPASDAGPCAGGTDRLKAGSDPSVPPAPTTGEKLMEPGSSGGRSMPMPPESNVDGGSSRPPALSVAAVGSEDAALSAAARFAACFAARRSASFAAS